MIIMMRYYLIILDRMFMFFDYFVSFIALI